MNAPTTATAEAQAAGFQLFRFEVIGELFQFCHFSRFLAFLRFQLFRFEVIGEPLILFKAIRTGNLERFQLFRFEVIGEQAEGTSYSFLHALLGSSFQLFRFEVIGELKRLKKLL